MKLIIRATNLKMILTRNIIIQSNIYEHRVSLFNLATRQIVAV
jgi:hypothetical protein